MHSPSLVAPSHRFLDPDYSYFLIRQNLKNPSWGLRTFHGQLYETSLFQTNYKVIEIFCKKERPLKLLFHATVIHLQLLVALLPYSLQCFIQRTCLPTCREACCIQRRPPGFPDYSYFRGVVQPDSAIFSHTTLLANI